LDEETIDRRAHWAWAIVSAIVAATVFCVTIKLTMNQLEQDFKDYKKEQKVILKDQDNKGDDLDHRVIVLETIQACKDGTRNYK
jgi:sensor domain CHASE-containing protein